MSWIAAAWIMGGGSILLLFFGLPVAFTFLVVDIIGAVFWMGGEPGLVQLTRNSVVAVTAFSLTPIPLFVLMGEVLFHTGLAAKVIEGIERLIHQVPGRLAVITVVAGTVFSAISHSTIATTAMLGTLMLPIMLARGYRPTMATGPIMAIGAIDILMPLSALAVLLGSLGGIPISKLLVAGATPGLALAVIFIVYIIIRAKRDPLSAPPGEVQSYYGWERYRLLVMYVLPLVSSLAVVIIAMTAGWATPTESAAIGALAPLVLAAAYGVLTPTGLIKALKGTVAISGMILFIILGAITFAQILTISGASDGLISMVVRPGVSSTEVVAGMMLVLIILGIFVDQVSMMMITLPIFMPIVRAFQIDLVWFGVMYLMCMQLGLLMPPHGLLLMTMRGVSPPTVTMGDIYRAVVPYVILSLAMLAFVFEFPKLIMWLPNLSH